MTAASNPPPSDPPAPGQPPDGQQPPGALNPAPLPLGGIRVRADYLACARGRRAARPNLVVQAAPSARAGSGVRAGFTATRKIGGAVVRNRAKRRLRAASRQLLPWFGRPGCDYVFIARAAAPACPWPALLDDMQSALISLARHMEQDGAPSAPAAHPR